ncbi:MAG: type I DNA topoisomerase [Flavobacteriaceae bacterium]
MSKNLVIVESATKAKTIEKILGKDFKVASCFGHISDLPSNELGVNVDDNFIPKYIISSDKKKIVNELKKLSKKADIVWLASDEDREGEAIAWHLSNNLNLNQENSRRIVFSEITKKAIKRAIEEPRDINTNLVNAQQARRVLDRLVGYELSPVLWKKVKGGLSAGRVQSVAVRLIVEKERLIKEFIPKQSFKTQAKFITNDGKYLLARLYEDFTDENFTKTFFEKNKNANYKVNSILKKPSKKFPSPPFTTSTLQQEASRKLSFSVSKTMTVAQRLYEAGLITYMRTDSVNLSEEAKNSIANEIISLYGKDYLSERNYKSKSKGAQEAHEAIRPTDFSKSTISSDYDQSRLYDLIWRRTVSSQMSEAKIEKTQIEILSDQFSEKFIADGEVIVFDGFLKVYLEGKDDEEENNKGILPLVNKGDKVTRKKMISRQRFSRPPYRFSEASLVKKLEELGIGRPSTFAPTISTIQNRGYIEKGNFEGINRGYKELELKDLVVIENELTELTGSDRGKLVPTDIGSIVNNFLVSNFKSILDFNFTAQVEESFDDIAKGTKDWTEMIDSFYKKFHSNVEDVKENAKRESGERILGNDPKTGRVLKVRLGKFGPIAQLGELNDEKNPVYASLTKNQLLETITFEEAIKLFEFPKIIGSYENNEVSVNNGRYGPYIKFDKTFISIPKDSSPYSINIDDAIKLVEEKRKADAPIHIYNDLPVIKGVGRFGPFLKWNGLFINVNKSYDFENLQKNQIEDLIKERIQKDKDKLIHDWKESGIRVEKARWGRSVIIQGKKKVQLSKDIDPQKLTKEDVEGYLGKKSKK